MAASGDSGWKTRQYAALHGGLPDALTTLGIADPTQVETLCYKDVKGLLKKQCRLLLNTLSMIWYDELHASPDARQDIRDSTYTS